MAVREVQRARAQGTESLLAASGIGDLRRRWTNELRNYAPGGVNPGGHNDIGDAFRHYETAGKMSSKIGQDFTVWLGDVGEYVGGNPEGEKVMDRHNNRAGARAGATTKDPIELALKFMNEVAEGKIMIRDKNSGDFRESRASDLPHGDGDRLEDRYRPDRPDRVHDPFGETDTIVA